MLKFAALAAFVMNLLAFLWGFVCVSVPGNFPARQRRKFPAISSVESSWLVELNSRKTFPKTLSINHNQTFIKFHQINIIRSVLFTRLTPTTLHPVSNPSGILNS